jgi:hypothetical protein
VLVEDHAGPTTKVGPQVPRAVTVKISVFGDVEPCSVADV